MRSSLRAADKTGRAKQHDGPAPRISEFYGIVIEMYFADHPPPHFPRYGGDEVTVVIETGEVLAGSVPGRARGPTARGPTEMTELIKIRTVEPLEGEWLRLTFSDGAVKDVDVSGLLDGGGVFAPIRDSRDLFEQVRVNPETRTVEWPGQVDLDPDVLYGRYEPASGIRIERRTVREPSSAAHA